MKTDEILSEMLSELKNIKDLTKENIPIVANEYIRANKINNFLGLGVGVLFLIIAAAITIHTFIGKTDSIVYIPALILGLIGFIMSSVSISGLVNFYFQPRRMAIKAITSLRGNNE